MRRIKLEKLANAKMLAVVPFNKNQSDKLRDEERHTLRAFGDVMIEVSTLQAFPLNVVQLRGSTRNLAVYPRVGTINLGRSKRLELRNDRGEEVQIHSKPFKAE